LPIEQAQEKAAATGKEIKALLSGKRL